MRVLICSEKILWHSADIVGWNSRICSHEAVLYLRRGPHDIHSRALRARAATVQR